MNKHSIVLQHLSIAPESQIDSSITPKLKALSEQAEVKSDELLDILDRCTWGALASDFAMMSMNIVWNTMVLDEGKTIEDAFKEAKPRRDQLQKELDGNTV